MTRPTVEGLGHATDCLEHLAWRWHQHNDNGYHQVAGILDLLVYLDSELEIHRRNSVLGPGVDAHTIGRHRLNRPVESRLDWGTEEGRKQRGGPAQPPVEPSDAVYKALRKLQHEVVRTLTSFEAQWQHEAGVEGGWPHRSEVG